MAVSGSYDWTLTRNQIITDALEDLGAIDAGGTLDDADLAVASTKLNGIVKTLKNKHIHLWAVERETKTFVASSAVTNGGSTYRCTKGHTSAATDEPGVGADWTTYWVLDAVDGAGAWVLATAYTSNNEFTVADDTIGIDAAFIRDGGYDYPIDIISYEQYSKIFDKSREGKPYCLVLDMQRTPEVTLYYHPDEITEYVLHYQRIRKLQDFDAAGNHWDGPESWIPLLVKMLRYELAPKFGISLQERLVFKLEADEELKIVKRDDREPEEEEYIKGAFENDYNT